MTIIYVVKQDIPWSHNKLLWDDLIKNEGLIFSFFLKNYCNDVIIEFAVIISLIFIIFIYNSVECLKNIQVFLNKGIEEE